MPTRQTANGGRTGRKLKTLLIFLGLSLKGSGGLAILGAKGRPQAEAAVRILGDSWHEWPNRGGREEGTSKPRLGAGTVLFAPGFAFAAATVAQGRSSACELRSSSSPALPGIRPLPSPPPHPQHVRPAAPVATKCHYLI